HGGRIVARHTAVAGGCQIERLALQGGYSITSQRDGSQNGAGNFRGLAPAESKAKPIGPAVNVCHLVANVKGLMIDFFLWQFQHAEHLPDYVANVGVTAADGSAARMKIEALGGDS